MALKATIYKAELTISDMDRHYYESHNLTLARHPSETDDRLMIRLLVFILNAGPDLQFTKGLSTQDEPDLWVKSLSNEIELWIELGQPDEKRIRQICGKASKVIIYNYSGNSADIWWQQMQPKLARFNNLSVFNISAEQTDKLSELARKNMLINASLQDGEVYLSDSNHSATISVSQRLS